MSDNETPVSMAALAGVNMSDIEEKRREPLPALKGRWAIKEEGTEFIEGETQEGVPYARINVVCELVEVEAILDKKKLKEMTEKGQDMDMFEGRMHTEGFYISLKSEEKMLNSLGFFKAFFMDIDCTIDGTDLSPEGLVQELHDHEFVGVLKAKPDRNDADIIRNEFGKVGPVGSKL